MIVIILAFYCFASICVSIRFLRLLQSPIARLPGPIYSAFTSAWLKYQEFSGRRRLYIHELHEEYGPIVRLGPNEVSFTSPEAVREIYTSGGSGYDRTELYSLFKQFNTRTLFSTLNREEHSQRKRHLADRYANSNIVRPENLRGLHDRAQTFVANCLESPDGYADVYVQLHCFALDGATHHLFQPYGTDSLSDPNDLEMMKELSYHDSLKKSLLKYYSPTLSSLLHGFARPRPAPLANAYVLSTCKRPDPGPLSLLSKLQSKASDLPVLTVPAECMDQMVAGIDTTGDALCFLIYALSIQSTSARAIQERLQCELLSNPSLTFDQLPYLDAVVKEGLRCWPPVPMSFPRYVPAGGRTIDDVWIPEGTIVSCQPYTLHKNEVVFPKALEFLPERWLEAEGAKDREDLYFAFSRGSRGCLGKSLALAEMKILLRELYTNCKTTVSDQMDGDMDIADQIISSRPRGQTCKLVFERIGKKSEW